MYFMKISQKHIDTIAQSLSVEPDVLKTLLERVEKALADNPLGEVLYTNLVSSLAGTDSQTLINEVKQEVSNLENPHHALELELARLVEARVPPGGALYVERENKTVSALEFFYSIYESFYKAKILYSHHLRAMDLDLYTRIKNSKSPDRPILPSVTEYNEHLLQAQTLQLSLLPKLTRALYRSRGGG